MGLCTVLNTHNQKAREEREHQKEKKVRRKRKGGGKDAGAGGGKEAGAGMGAVAVAVADRVCSRQAQFERWFRVIDFNFRPSSLPHVVSLCSVWDQSCHLERVWCVVGRSEPVGVCCVSLPFAGIGNGFNSIVLILMQRLRVLWPNLLVQSRGIKLRQKKQ